MTCAGRTDTGVHARGQVVHLDVERAASLACAARSTAPPEETLLRRLNGVLPPDVRVRRWRRRPRASTHGSRRSGGATPTGSPTSPGWSTRWSDGTVLAWPRPLDLDAMNEAAAGLVGEHDFAAFCKRREGATTIRTLLDLVWERDATGLAVATVRADAFCHHMVRALVGCDGRGRGGPPAARLGR